MRIAFPASSAIVAIALATPALAQDTARPATDAAGSADDSGNTADIVVTAQQRTERLHDIPVAAAVLSADAVTQNHVTDLSDINRGVPSALPRVSAARPTASASGAS